MASKWWGWGDENKAYHLPDPQRFWTYVRARLGATEPASRLDLLQSVRLRPHRLPAAVLSGLAHVEYRQVRCVEFASETPVPVETDGDLVGTVPAIFDVLPARLTVLA